MIVETLPVTRPADEAPGPPQGQWTYEAYATLPDDGNRYEIIDGVLYVSPSPAPRHQRRLLRLVTVLATHVEDHRVGELFLAPMDLVMPGCSPVQPDLFLFLEGTPVQIDEGSPPIIGVPDLAVEVLSPSTAGYDRREKQDAYGRAGVREYWPVDPLGRTIEVLVLEGGVYRSRGVAYDGMRVPSTVLPGLPYTMDELLGD